MDAARVWWVVFSGLASLTFCASPHVAATDSVLRLDGAATSAPDLPPPSGLATLDGFVALTQSQGIMLRAAGWEGTVYVSEERYHRIGGLRVRDGDSGGPREQSVRGEDLAVVATSEDALVAHRTDPLARIGGSPVLSALGVSSDAFRVFPTVQPGLVEANALNRHKALQVASGSIAADLAGQVRYSGPIDLYAWGTDVSYSWGGQTVVVRTGRHSEGPAVGVSGGEVERYLHFVGSVKNLTWEPTVDARTWLQAADLPYEAATISLQGVTGEMTWGDSTRSLTAAHVRAEMHGARLNFVRVGSTDGTFGVHLEGPVNRLWIDGTLAALVTTTAGNVQTAAWITLMLAAVGSGLVWLGRTHPLWLAFLSRRIRLTGYAPYLATTLSNPLRRRTLELIRGEPGIQAYHVWKSVGGAAGVTHRNLHRLEETGLVRSVRIGRFRHYFIRGRDATPDRHVQALLATRAGGQTYALLRRMGSATQHELARHLGISQAAVSLRLSRLREFGLAERDAGRGSSYRAVSTPAADAFWQRRAADSPVAAAAVLIEDPIAVTSA